MPFPFPEYAEPAQALKLPLNLLPYPEVESIAADATMLGEVVTAAEEIGAAAILLEPALIVGTGIAAALAAEAILDKISPTSAKPAVRNRKSGGRIGGGKFYEVDLEWEIKDQGKSTSTNVNAGAIGSPYYESVGGQQRWNYTANGIKQPVFSASPDLIIEQLTITDIRPVDGLPDPDIKSTPEWVSPGSGVIPSPTSRPITIPGLGATPIDFQPLPSPRLQPDSSPLQVQFPGVIVQVPALGITVAFAPQGAALIFTAPASDSKQIPPTPSIQEKYRYPTPGCDCPPPNMTEVLCRIKRLQTDLLDSGYTLVTHAGMSGQGGVTNFGALIPVSVSIDITAKSSKERTQEYSTSTPTVYFIGWFSWMINGVPGERTPISFLQTSWIAPDNATGYMFSLHDLASANSSYITKLKKDYVDNC